MSPSFTVEGEGTKFLRQAGHAVVQLVEALWYKPIPDGLIGIFHWHNPSGRTMTLNTTLPLTEMGKVNQSHYRPELPRGFQEVKVPRLRDNGPG